VKILYKYPFTWVVLTLFDFFAATFCRTCVVMPRIWCGHDAMMLCMISELPRVPKSQLLSFLV
jgi:hypothetical protein